ncbi:putative uncharacterized protein DDB_G0286901 isoform X1 [Diabrotica virgifera virgifera]|uniref:Uncharacterized protein n=1 Tax=Diabrotica virgifera virgifera TaxID=50390 RepID=A0ABM5K373_DIAVI|nr:putative uncharacterized protein DDB_G0286901 isoform X1 [Diabrotica virgifera virgifera]XP_050504641.1 putative uncharacterized protein DDB_G0286901 isoform X1 [Diabrotica virgifera virgifera]XP_050504642.1 putative uncharacterized protein DDB_G0286901 isoform X1 [Diabrotica virgifera virgifera]XP_050504643.1 putative uncharacterized protein DDB_G0286901 isoform X1 [Diabrotica virgifera virgifera]XP_050504644.1 putative uncharacterized protein DDB_G0286901 isoform X1 [Diabrotica virgifera v
MPRTSKNSSSQSINILQDLQVRPQTSNGKAKKITSSMYFLDEEPDYSDSDEDFFNIRGKEPVYGEYIYITKPVRKNCNVEVQCDILTIEKSLDAFVTKCAELDPNTVGRYKQLVLLCKELVNDRYFITSDPYHCDTNSDAERSSENLKVFSEKEEEEISVNNLKSINSRNKEENNIKSNQKRLSTKNSAFEEESDSNGNKQKKSKRSNGNLGVISETNEKDISTDNLKPNKSRNKEENNRKPNQKRLSTKNSAFEEESDFNGNKQEKSKRSNGNLGVISETNEEDISTDNLKPNKSTNKEQNNKKSNQKRLSTKNSAIEVESDSNGNKHEKSKRSKFNVGCVSESDEEEISTQNVERIPSTNKKNKRTKLESLKFIIGSSLFGGKKRDSRRLSTSEKTENELNNRDKSSKIIEPTKGKVIQRSKRKLDENKLAENKENHSDGNKEESRRSHNGNLSETELDRTSLSSKKI